MGAITAAGDPIPDGAEHITAIPGTGSIMNFERAIPMEIARLITRLKTGDPWIFKSTNEIDPQTLRGVQRISAKSESLLNDLLGFINGSYKDKL